MSKARLLQMSGVVIDLVYRVDRVPQPGQEAVVEESMITPGGGFNAMVAARRAGMDVSYGGSHGNGRFADIVRGAISELDIPILQDKLDHSDQGSCVVLVDQDGERTFISQAGAERYFGSNQFHRIDLSTFDFVLISGYTFALSSNPDLLDNWLSAFPDGPHLIFDPSPIVDQIPASILRDAVRQSSWVSANAVEAEAMTNCSAADQSAEALCSMMGDRREGAVVRNGAEGCWLALPGERAVHIREFKVDPVDTNGAGDTHIGAFVAALGNGENPANAVRYANAAAALSTLERGPAAAPTHQQTLDFIRRQPGSVDDPPADGRQRVLHSTNT